MRRHAELNLHLYLFLPDLGLSRGSESVGQMNKRMDGWLMKWRNAALLGPNTIASSAVLSIWRLCHTVTLWELNTAPTQAVQLVTLKGHYLEVTPKPFSLLSRLPPLFTSVVLCECRVRSSCGIFYARNALMFCFMDFLWCYPYIRRELDNMLS